MFFYGKIFLSGRREYNALETPQALSLVVPDFGFAALQLALITKFTF